MKSEFLLCVKTETPNYENTLHIIFRHSCLRGFIADLDNKLLHRWFAYYFRNCRTFSRQHSDDVWKFRFGMSSLQCGQSHVTLTLKRFED